MEITVIDYGYDFESAKWIVDYAIQDVQYVTQINPHALLIFMEQTNFIFVYDHVQHTVGAEEYFVSDHMTNEVDSRVITSDATEFLKENVFVPDSPVLLAYLQALALRTETL